MPWLRYESLPVGIPNLSNTYEMCEANEMDMHLQETGAAQTHYGGYPKWRNSA